jgi:hypothetical protein
LDTVNAITRVALGVKRFPGFAGNCFFTFAYRCQFAFSQHFPLGGIQGRAIYAAVYFYTGFHFLFSPADRYKFLLKPILRNLADTINISQSKSSEIAPQYDIDQGESIPRAVSIRVKKFFSLLYCALKMTDNENDIQNAANNMIERYGDNALTEVDLRILELESRNQQEALRLWREIRRRVELLIDTSPSQTKH